MLDEDAEEIKNEHPAPADIENTANFLMTPGGLISVDEPTLRDLVSLGAVQQVAPAIRKNPEKPIVLDFIKHFYPKDPDGAKRYFTAEFESRNEENKNKDIKS